MIYDSSVIAHPPAVADGVRVVPAPCAAIAQDLGAVMVKNVVALGALQAATDLLPAGSLLGELRRSLAHKEKLVPLNEAAFAAGVRAVSASPPS
jgi:2-oxoisovalerate ferredoxin oxidoreductase beta subunit